MKFRIPALISLVGILCMAASTGPHAQGLGVPQLINYQGKLADAQGQAPETGDYTLSFSIYDEPFLPPCSSETSREGTPKAIDCARRVWGPQVFDGKTDAVGHGLQVPVVRGYFNVILGPYDIRGTPILQGFMSSNRFLEVTVGGGDPVIPRQQVLSTPFALASAGAVPVGGIIAYSGDPASLPDNWMICNGDDIDDTDSPLYGTSVPDLRGLFVRGTEAPVRTGAIGGIDTISHSHDFTMDVTTSSKVGGYYSERYVYPDSNEETGFWLYKAGHYSVSRQYEALAVDDETRESHEHDVKIERTPVITTAVVPRHMSLYYAMRIK